MRWADDGALSNLRICQGDSATLGLAGLDVSNGRAGREKGKEAKGKGKASKASKGKEAMEAERAERPGREALLRLGKGSFPERGYEKGRDKGHDRGYRQGKENSRGATGAPGRAPHVLQIRRSESKISEACSFSAAWRTSARR